MRTTLICLHFVFSRRFHQKHDDAGFPGDDFWGRAGDASIPNNMNDNYDDFSKMNKGTNNGDFTQNDDTMKDDAKQTTDDFANVQAGKKLLWLLNIGVRDHFFCIV